MYKATVHGYIPTQVFSSDLEKATAPLKPLKAAFAELNAKLDEALTASKRTLEGLGAKLDIPS